MAKVYATTAIPYMNAAPHVGHALDYLLADAFKRYQDMQGNEVVLQAGSDEHGNKIFKKAAEQGLNPQNYVDQNVAKFQDFIQMLGVEYTSFMRTTSPEHKKLVRQIWLKLQDYIYAGEYEGWYCEGCESFVTQKEYEENGGECPDHKKPYQKLLEKNYYLRISDFKNRIRQAIETGEMKILPEFRAKEILQLLEDSPDVSISRPVEHLSWGIEVPNDPSQVIYVWIDALANYLTVLGYPEKSIRELWPASLQVVGKDILRFHAIIWPAMLLGLGLELPKVIVSHGFIQADGQKMSKTIGNIVDPIDVLNRHGVDAFRYFFFRHIDTFADANFTWEKFENAYSNELANDLGNLVQRLAVLCKKNSIKECEIRGSFDSQYQKLMDNFEFTKAMDYCWGKLQGINREIDEKKPWALAKSDPEAAKLVLTELVQNLLQVNYLLKPFLPITNRIEKIFTAEEIDPPATPLFPKDK